jgi:hypothetical protein
MWKHETVVDGRGKLTFSEQGNDNLKKEYIIMKFSQAISWVRWFSFVETNVSKTISFLVLRLVELMWTEMVFKMLVSTELNHLTQLIAQENFIILTHWESIKSYIRNTLLLKLT